MLRAFARFTICNFLRYFFATILLYHFSLYRYETLIFFRALLLLLRVVRALKLRHDGRIFV
jgi:hypothetical protein